MKVIWLPTAKAAVRSTAKYIRREFGKRYGEAFLQEVREASMLIGSNPNIGQVEPLLVTHTVKYRSYVMNRLNKIIYTIKEDRIEVADFWDTRREPVVQAENIK